MSTPTSHSRKSRSDSVLKSFSPEIQDEIGRYGEGRSLAAVQEWLEKTHRVKPALSAISDFLTEFRVIDERYRHRAAMRGMATPLESSGPVLSQEDLQLASQRHFAEKVIHDSNISAFNQSERNAIKREELEIRRQEAQIQREEMQIERERLKLEQEKFQRSHSEYIVNTCNNPKIGAAARKKGVSYAHKVKEVDTIMFGPNETTN